MTHLKQTARDIFQDTLSSIDIPSVMTRKLARAGSIVHCGDAKVDLAAFEEIRIVAFGKASYAMTRGMLDVLAPDFKAEGVLSIPSEPPAPLPGIQIFIAGHPVPNPASFEAGRAVLDLLRTCDERTLIFFLLSGGGSVLVESPLDAAVSLADIQALNRALVTCGAPIDDMNAIRKHLSATKGGRMAAAAPKAMKISFGVTDVPEGKESALASGPTIPDPTTTADAYRVAEQYHLIPKLPASIRIHFEKRDLMETPKAGDAAFERATFSLLLGMHDLFHQAHRAAEARGFFTVCDNSTDDWPLEKSAAYLLELLEKMRAQHPGKPVAVIADGEVSCPVTGNGLGGRNSAFALHCAEKISGKQVVVLSAGTDGVDGNSPAAGAVADGETLARARAAGLDSTDYFRRSDAFSFFKKLGDAIETGPTGNNLRDLRILLAEQ
ncbi:MAG: DUF4147 domain-containing protein [Acidobacteria bacterium]|nr:DUF4147 domain-containing protein [Acidobacteriota bacterium]